MTLGTLEVWAQILVLAAIVFYAIAGACNTSESIAGWLARRRIAVDRRRHRRIR